MPSQNSLPTRRRYAVLVSAALVSRDEERLIQVYREALDNVFNTTELVELILQSLLFDGYPCALEGLITLKSVLGSGLPADEPFEEYNPGNIQDWRSRGEILCRQIYGANYERLLTNVAGLSPTLREWMLYEGYGRVLSRAALSIDLRELGIISILTIKNLPRQLHSHLRGALRVGVTRAELEEAIDLCALTTSPENIQSARKILQEIQ